MVNSNDNECKSNYLLTETIEDSVEYTREVEAIYLVVLKLCTSVDYTDKQVEEQVKSALDYLRANNDLQMYDTYLSKLLEELIEQYIQPIVANSLELLDLL